MFFWKGSGIVLSFAHAAMNAIASSFPFGPNVAVVTAAILYVQMLLKTRLIAL